MSRNRAHRDSMLLLAFALSGCAALGYELLWTRLLSIALGHETLGVLGVLAGFFFGMALGSAVFHRRVTASSNPLRMFVILEIVAAGYALASPWLLHALAANLPPAIGPGSAGSVQTSALAASIAISGATLLPGTFCMGATLAALVEARRRVYRDDVEGRGVARLYAVNTLGATIGVLGTIHLVLPSVGVAGGAAVLAALGLAAAGLATMWGRPYRTTLSRPRTRNDDPSSAIDTSKDPDPDVVRERWLVVLVLGATGLVGVGLEVVGVQILSQLLENTVYTFADVLAVYLVGTAVGAAMYARYAKQAVAGRPATVAAGMLIALAVSVVISALVLANTGTLLESVAPLGASYRAHLTAEIVAAAAVFALPTMLMGAIFAHLTALVADDGVGYAYAANTLGSALAPILFGLYVIPANGYRDAYFAVAIGYLIIFGLFTWFRRFPTKWQLVPIVAVLSTFALAPESMVLAKAEDGWTTLEQQETVMGLVIVSEQEGQEGKAAPMRRLQVGKIFKMGGRLAFGERRMGHIPLLMAPHAKRALFLGVGTGATLGAVADFPLTEIDAVELVPAVVDQLEYFDSVNAAVRNDERVTLHAADARRFVAASATNYDVIVADLFHPGRDGAGGLYALEHFEQVRDHLNPGGLFAQWLPLYQLDPSTARTIVRTFAEAFDEVHSVLGIYNVATPAVALIGRVPDASGEPLSIDVAGLTQTLGQPVYSRLLMTDPRDLAGAYLLDRNQLLTFAGDAPLNTDFFPRVLLEAPKGAYLDDPNRGWVNLEAMLSVTPEPNVTIWNHADPGRLTTFQQDGRRFATALRAYLQAEAARRRADGASTIPMTAIDHYLAAYEAAPEFAPARPMLYIAAAQTGDRAERIYPRMLAATPDDRRVLDAYLRYLRQSGDQTRYQALRERARELFGPASGPDAPP